MTLKNNFHRTLFLCGISVLLFSSLGKGAKAETDQNTMIDTLKYRALRYCQKGDTCVSVRKNCHEWIAVRDVYKEDAFTLYLNHSIFTPCTAPLEGESKPVARCMPALKSCVLTGEKILRIDPRLQAK